MLLEHTKNKISIHYHLCSYCMDKYSSNLCLKSDNVNDVSHGYEEDGISYYLYGGVVIDCMPSPNNTRSPTTIPTPAPTEAPTPIPTKPDYLWLVGSQDEESEYTAEFGCNFAVFCL